MARALREAEPTDGSIKSLRAENSTSGSGKADRCAVAKCAPAVGEQCDVAGRRSQSSEHQPRCPSCTPHNSKVHLVVGAHEILNPCQSRSGALRGEALAHRIGFERPRADMAERLAAVIGSEADGPMNGDRGDRMLRLSLDEARRLPPTVLMSSCTDKIVPW